MIVTVDRSEWLGVVPFLRQSGETHTGPVGALSVFGVFLAVKFTLCTCVSAVRTVFELHLPSFPLKTGRAVALQKARPRRFSAPSCFRVCGLRVPLLPLFRIGSGASSGGLRVLCAKKNEVLHKSFVTNPWPSSFVSSLKSPFGLGYLFENATNDIGCRRFQGW